MITLWIKKLNIIQQMTDSTGLPAWLRRFFLGG